MKINLKTIYRILLLIALVAVGVKLAISDNITAYLNVDFLTKLLTDTKPWSYLIYTLLMIIAIVISPLPSLPLNLAAGKVFGPYLGTILSLSGASIGACISFMIARFLGRDFISRHIKGHINFCTDCSNRLLSKLVFISRLIPFLSFDIISYGAGLTNMSLRIFFLATLLGMIPLTAAYNFYGNSISYDSTSSAAIGIIFILLFLFFPVLIEKYNIFNIKKYFKKH